MDAKKGLVSRVRDLYERVKKNGDLTWGKQEDGSFRAGYTLNTPKPVRVVFEKTPSVYFNLKLVPPSYPPKRKPRGKQVR
ncbi:hypothetical protein [Streptomyces hygroscopicus]|uniref:hypothetical protein n=1 Tax=Streptomyces hygroscopicus TaxID=1912 RepID=UPI0037BD193E